VCSAKTPFSYPSIIDPQGCRSDSSTFGFLTHSDQFNPELMQATKNITLQDLGRRFRFSRVDIETVSGRSQNWLDTDGSVSGLNEPVLIGSGLQSAGMWWRVGKFHNDFCVVPFLMKRFSYY
jgi:hypothetical protein